MASLFESKRGFSWAGLLAFIVIIGSVVAFSGYATRECSKDVQCGENKYCGADFSCHQMPQITITRTEVRSDYTTPATILGISIVLASLILKKRQ